MSSWQSAVGSWQGAAAQPRAVTPFSIAPSVAPLLSAGDCRRGSADAKSVAYTPTIAPSSRATCHARAIAPEPLPTANCQLPTEK
jgi:hypothetical protein